MSDTSARANRFAFAFGSFARKGLIGGRAGVDEAPVAGELAIAEAGVGTVEGAGLDAAGVERTAGVDVGGVAGRGPGTGCARLGVANGGTEAVAFGGVHRRAPSV